MTLKGKIRRRLEAFCLISGIVKVKKIGGKIVCVSKGVSLGAGILAASFG